MADRRVGSQFERVVARLAPGGRLLRVWPLQGGISAGMTALEVAVPDGQVHQWIVRRPPAGVLAQFPQAAWDEYRLLQRLSALGLPVPQALDYDGSGAIFPGAYLVLAYVEGQPDFTTRNLPSHLAQAATLLARIHRADLSGGEFSFLPRQAEGFPELLRRTQTDPAFETDRIRAALQTARSRRNPPALLHGDFWPGNLLWQAEKLAAVIDWEDAMLGEPLFDLAIARLDLAWIFGIEAMQTFTDAYLSEAGVDATGLPYWDLNAVLRLARLVGDDPPGWAAFFQPYGRADTTPASILAKVRIFVRRAFDRLQR